MFEYQRPEIGLGRDRQILDFDEAVAQGSRMRLEADLPLAGFQAGAESAGMVRIEPMIDNLLAREEGGAVVAADGDFHRVPGARGKLEIFARFGVLLFISQKMAGAGPVVGEAGRIGELDDRMIDDV